MVSFTAAPPPHSAVLRGGNGGFPRNLRQGRHRNRQRHPHRPALRPRAAPGTIDPEDTLVIDADQANDPNSFHDHAPGGTQIDGHSFISPIDGTTVRKISDTPIPAREYDSPYTPNAQLPAFRSNATFLRIEPIIDQLSRASTAPTFVAATTNTIQLSPLDHVPAAASAATYSNTTGPGTILITETVRVHRPPPSHSTSIPATGLNKIGVTLQFDNVRADASIDTNGGDFSSTGTGTGTFASNDLTTGGGAATISHAGNVTLNNLPERFRSGASPPPPRILHRHRRPAQSPSPPATRNVQTGWQPHRPSMPPSPPHRA